MKTFIIIAFACITSVTIFGQEHSFIWSHNQLLQWNDFQGPANDTSLFDAESYAEVRYTYKYNSPENYNFEVYAVFNKNASWCRKQFRQKDLLKHEQLHFDIAELFSRKLRDAFKQYPFTENFNKEVQQVFNPIKVEYHSVQALYDEETNHSLNKENQVKWDREIAMQLTVLKPGTRVEKLSTVALVQQ